MGDVFLGLLLLSILLLVIGLIRPQLFNKVLGNKASRGKAAAILGGATLVLAVLTGVTLEPTPPTAQNQPANETAAQTSNEQSAQQKKEVSEGAAEQYCQDAGLLEEYISLEDNSIINLASYNKYYTDSGSVDEDGNPIWVFQWNGKNKQTGEPILFVCQVSGVDDNSIELHSLAIDGSPVYMRVDPQGGRDGE